MLNFPDSSVETEYTDSNGVQWAFDGVGWVQKIGVNVSGGGDCNIPILDSPPANPELGEQWFSSTDGYLYIWYGSEWVAIGGAGGGDGGDGGSAVDDPYWSSVELLLNADGLPNGSANIVDASGKQVLTNINNVVASTSILKYGTGSLDFSQNTSNSLTFGPVSFGTNDFTLEGWAYLTQVNAQQALIDFRPAGTQGDYPTIMFLGSGRQLSYYAQSTEKIKMADQSPQDTWFHWAVARAAGTTTLYFDGVAQGSFADSISYQSGTPAVGSTSYNVGASSVRGYLDDVRVTKGIARYTSDFTPPGKHPSPLVVLKGSESVQISTEPQESGNDADLS